MTKTMLLAIYNREGGYLKRNFSTKVVPCRKLRPRSNGMKTICWSI